MENDLVDKLKQLCDENGKETVPQQSAQILHQLGRIYLERSEMHVNHDSMTMISLIRSSCLFNAAITRKPENLQVIQNDLKALCRQVLIKAGARDINADLIAQSNIVKQDIQNMRDKVRQQLDEIDSNQNKQTNELEKENTKITDIKNLQTDITTQYTNIMAELLQYCQTVMGDARCKSSLVGLGSLARKEITPYSDFEHIIVLEQNSEQRSDYKDVLKYFRWLSVVFHIVVINLQETILPCVNIPSLKWFCDGFTTHGICFDGVMPYACKFPLGRAQPKKKSQWTNELIKPVNEMLKYFDFENDLKNGYRLKDIITKTCYVGGDKSIFDEFQTKVYNKLKNLNHKEKVSNLKNFLIQDLENYALKSVLLDLSSTSLDIKNDFYRASTIFISALGQLYDVEASSCFDISEALETMGVINNKVKHYQMYAVALACELRLKCYTKQKRQSDVMQNTADDKDVIQILLNTMKASSVIKYFQIAYAIQCDVSKQFDLPKIHFFSDPKWLNCILYYRFNDDRKFIKFVVDHVITECNKSYRLQSTEEIMAQLKDDSEMQNKLKDNQMLYPRNIELYIEEKLLEHALWFETKERYDKVKELLNIHLDMIENKQENKRMKSNSKFSNGSQQWITYIRRLLIIHKKVSIDRSDHVSFGKTLNIIGECVMDMHKPDQAITYLQRLLVIKENASLNLSQDISYATTIHNIGKCLMDMRKPGEAITYLQISLAIYEKASQSHYFSLDISCAKVRNNIGLCLMDMYKPGEASTYLQRSLTIQKNASLDFNRDVSFESTLNNIDLC